MIMTYRTLLDILCKLDITSLDIMIAEYCDSGFLFEYTDEEFDRLCEFVKYIYRKNDTTIDEIIETINRLMDEEQSTVDEITSMGKIAFMKKMEE